MRILITSGGTKVPIDTVRDLTNMSNGTFGAKIAREALIAGADVLFFRAKHSKTPFSQKFDFYREEEGDASQWAASWEKQLNRFANHWEFCDGHRPHYREYGFRNFDDYELGLREIIVQQKPDIIILAAAVSDYLVANTVQGKIRSADDHQIKLTHAPKVISRIREWHPDCCLVGFKLMVRSQEGELIKTAKKSCYENNCDLVVANDLADIKASRHTLHLVCQSWGGHKTYLSNPDDPNYLARMVVQETIKRWKECQTSSLVSQVV